ncbi:uncharacterized protein K452DRAFT_40326 [Aplosporella prunicola CBS 121167]|uniref:Uncharacterized protein n=1 Tax=Aplosporella prunicola CBS 121167 TaxID=1176127 RepID=A0A6A6BE23_9PEZI|nr:uncharacterized protein K452DRAFT_40326 [Aplosporella prunicola CBS 121167]KAF2141504.1 hypothetical protein K452DRAFT_40326 [Aplosporella prunicola CBS 121167]
MPSDELRRSAASKGLAREGLQRRDSGVRRIRSCSSVCWKSCARVQGTKVVCLQVGLGC